MGLICLIFTQVTLWKWFGMYEFLVGGPVIAFPLWASILGAAASFLSYTEHEVRNASFSRPFISC